MGLVPVTDTTGGRPRYSLDLAERGTARLPASIPNRFGKITGALLVCDDGS